jgi:hypothetical protein
LNLGYTLSSPEQSVLTCCIPEVFEVGLAVPQLLIALAHATLRLFDLGLLLLATGLQSLLALDGTCWQDKVDARVHRYA